MADYCFKFGQIRSSDSKIMGFEVAVRFPPKTSAPPSGETMTRMRKCFQDASMLRFSYAEYSGAGTSHAARWGSVFSFASYDFEQ